MSRPPTRTAPDANLAARQSENLRTLRRRMGLSTRTLARRAGMNPAAVKAVEDGVVPRCESLIRLAGALGVEVGELLDGLDWDPPVGSRPGRYVVYPAEPPEDDA